MAIREIKEFPENVKQNTTKSKIEADIKEALTKGITKFEFIGDYNFATLAPYASIIGEEITRATVRPALDKLQEELNLKFSIPVKIPKRNQPKFIKVIGHKGKDRYHVYCEINEDVLETIVAESVEEEARREKRNVK